MPTAALRRPPRGPQILSLRSASAGRYYVAVNRARVGGTSSGDFGSFVLTLDETAEPT